MPVLMVSENTSPHVGFSRNRSMVPSALGDHDAELERVLDVLQRDRRRRAGVAVRLDERGEVDVGEHVAGDHEERVVELVGGVAHRPGGAERRLLGGVAHASRRSRSRRRSSRGSGWRGTRRSRRCRRSRAARAASTMCSIIGLLASGIIGFGWLLVSGRSRVPSPPARITAFTTRSPASVATPGPRAARRAASGTYVQQRRSS